MFDLILTEIFDPHKIRESIDLVLEYKQVWLEVCAQNVGICRPELNLILSDGFPRRLEKSYLVVVSWQISSVLKNSLASFVLLSRLGFFSALYYCR